MLRCKTKWVSGVLALLFACVLAAGCSEQDTLSEQQVGALEQRVRDRWQTLVARDFSATWEFESPNYRSVFSKSMYKHQFSYGVEWELTGVEVVNYDARAAVASVVVRVMSRSTKPTSAASKAIGATPIFIREKWLLIDGEWWHGVNY